LAVSDFCDQVDQLRLDGDRLMAKWQRSQGHVS
jgi:hypothetical protein